MSSIVLLGLLILLTGRPGPGCPAQTAPAPADLAGGRSSVVDCGLPSPDPAEHPAERRLPEVDHSELSERWRVLEAKLNELAPESDEARRLVGELIQAVEAADAPAALRQRSAAMLGRIGEPARAAVPVLTRLVETAAKNGVPVSDPLQPAQWSLKALGLFGSTGAPAVSLLARLLAEEDRLLADRLLLADVLGWIGTGPAVETLTRQLLRSTGRNDEPGQALLRQVMIESLALNEVRAAAALPALIRSLNDGSTAVRRLACVAIGRLGPRGEPGLDALTERLILDSDPATRDAAAESLAQLGPPATPRLVRLLESEDAELRWRAARALGRIVPRLESVPDILTRAMADPEAPVRIEAIEAVWKISRRPERVARPLLSELSSPDRPIRRRAAQLLSSLSDWPDDVSTELRSRAAGDDDTARAAAWILRERQRRESDRAAGPFP